MKLRNFYGGYHEKTVKVVAAIIERIKIKFYVLLDRRKWLCQICGKF
jgi:hypothetical protein